MIEQSEFKEWLHSNTKYTDAVISDVVSRVKRADLMIEWNGEETYQFFLERELSYKELSVSVRSQIKRAVKLYAEYVTSKSE